MIKTFEIYYICHTDGYVTLEANSLEEAKEKVCSNLYSSIDSFKDIGDIDTYETEVEITAANEAEDD